MESLLTRRTQQESDIKILEICYDVCCFESLHSVASFVPIAVVAIIIISSSQHRAGRAKQTRRNFMRRRPIRYRLHDIRDLRP